MTRLGIADVLVLHILRGRWQSGSVEGRAGVGRSLTKSPGRYYPRYPVSEREESIHPSSRLLKCECPCLIHRRQPWLSTQAKEVLRQACRDMRQVG
jgi:hypothetical protein